MSYRGNDREGAQAEKADLNDCRCIWVESVGNVFRGGGGLCVRGDEVDFDILPLSVMEDSSFQKNK